MIEYGISFVFATKGPKGSHADSVIISANAHPVLMISPLGAVLAEDFLILLSKSAGQENEADQSEK